MASLMDDERQSGEQEEREEMFSFHPDILSQAGPLPRRSDGRTYDTNGA